jgi:uncharacterized membrane protein YqjE|tara:strand:- start:1565 stop:1741 length:177 start_codon:yes stop_codon:yes gene_type:complete
MTEQIFAWIKSIPLLLMLVDILMEVWRGYAAAVGWAFAALMLVALVAIVWRLRKTLSR